MGFGKPLLLGAFIASISFSRLEYLFCLTRLYLETFCLQNLTVERILPEVNKRVNYPIKRILVEMEEKNDINMLVRFCVSFVTVNVAAVGMERFSQSWNCHSISGMCTWL